jgi:hypothetical protein
VEQRREVSGLIAGAHAELARVRSQLRRSADAQ